MNSSSMKELVLKGIAVLAVMLATPAMAQDEEVEYGWSGVGEFGFVSTSGNTDSEALNLKLEFVKLSEQWKHRFTAHTLMTSEDGIDNNERYTFEAQSDRKLSDVSYLWGSFRWDADKFGAYDPQSTVSAGYGRELMKSDNHLLKAEIGAGYRSLEDRITGQTEDGAIVRLLLDDSWAITENTNWVNRLLVESGDDNTFSQFNSGLTVAMNDKLAVKLGYEIRHNTDIPIGTKDKTDTVTTANLVYNF